MSSVVDNIPFLSFQQRRILNENYQDLNLWQINPPENLWQGSTKNEIQKDYSRFISFMEGLRNSPIDYSSFSPDYNFASNHTSIVSDFIAPQKIMGRCPCPSEDPVLRCCNLKTLDAVQQCAFACAYCSIQSFYSENQIKVISNLDRFLQEMTVENGTWHIGTGQSSDSLLLGDDYGTLTALSHFAEKHKDIVIELKTKSSRIDWLRLSMPANVISTWSVNAKTVTQKEEHGAASLENRIKAAKLASDSGRLVGFHIHPMVYFTNWKNEYKELVNIICDEINPDNAVMIGIGALTFTKPNLKALRESQRPTRVTQMPLYGIAGKYSYSQEVKKEMFSFVYDSFPAQWKEKVFFYLCMENKDFWQPCLKRSYSSNAEFEEDMKKHYFAKISEKSHS